MTPRPVAQPLVRRLRSLVMLSWMCGGLVLASCGTLPSNGPLSIEKDTTTIGKDGDKNQAPDTSAYEIVDVNANTLAALQLYRPASFSEQFSAKLPPPKQVIAQGDQVAITIWEAASGGLFSDAAPPGANGARATAIPVQTIDSSGNMKVPYVGQLHVLGSTTSEVATAIEGRLTGMAIKPQVLVNIITNGSAWASVIGDVTGAARVPLSTKGDRLLDVIASAGGIKAMPFETHVRITRNNKTETVLLDAILKSPEEDIYIYPGDQIYVYREPLSYVALGAVTAQHDYPIDEEKVSLVQAVAKAGGLIDMQSNSSAVYLFRYETPDVVRGLHPDSSLLAHNTGEAIPVIYRVNFDKPENYLIAQEISVRDHDLVYVADADAVQFNKFLVIVHNIASIIGALRVNTLITN